ncbi:MAG: hypothetical protein ABIO44_06675 [Saprospiraceae bacterium]
MMRLRFIINVLISLTCVELQGQSWNWKLKDSLELDVQELYLDKLNQIYLIQKDKQSILKLNEDLSTNQEYFSSFISQYTFMDVKDPLKLLLFLPQFANVNFLDESLAPLSEEYFSNFNNESAICYYSTNQLCYYSEGKMNIRNLQDQKVQSGETIFYTRKTVNEVSQIKSNGQDVYLLFSGYGLWKFNAFLNIEYFLEDFAIKRMELMDDKLFVLKDSKIQILQNKNLTDDVIFNSNGDEIQAFSINKKYLLVALKNKVLRYEFLN